MAAQKLAQTAQTALLYEVIVWPKPGLVDPVDSGSHQDMDIFTFMNSAVSLLPYFQAAGQAGQTFAGTDLWELFQQLRQLGQDAEQTMFLATNQVNTHKGAIFSLGIAVGATAYYCQQHDFSVLGVQQVVRNMLKGLTKHDFNEQTTDFSQTLTAGQKQYRQYGMTGVRGEAEAGFPSVVQGSLPFLRRQTGYRQQRLLNTLMFLAAQTADSNLIKRAQSVAVLPWIKQQVEHFFALGGARSSAGQDFLTDLNQSFIQRNLSLGGCADLLILTIYFALLEGSL
ncbi:triphosphoribosyl-dephospho-CoA synthase CitG [Bombilactobacillus folatiphilus]|uniref:Probable 2-(5''-triphosphoribosyl)-3'-dephosphocoenzyme-A synthase n=1 Tax=Bombilactobacillus folatiphilus TaxID=2923362 RepID=A0ABY4PAZ1_9LACO|nr:triphosphoribosyl-dephospho-CoA synthase CitG [Bombilactobacillus folatiphilus]UQS82925.1 triphosphoribosyl-dephospho-CoA synthase CitG [Bombilactobacillus folatiphilus]